MGHKMNQYIQNHHKPSNYKDKYKKNKDHLKSPSMSSQFAAVLITEMLPTAPN